MPDHRSFQAVVFVVLFFTLSGLAATASAQQPTPSTGLARAGIAKLVKGQVKVGQGAPERPLESGDAVNAQDTVFTGADSAASMVLRDGTVVVLGANSRMELKDFKFNATTYEGNVAVDLLRGTMRMITGLVGKTRHDAVRVQTPTALIGIRGTDFIVEVEDGGVAQ